MFRYRAIAPAVLLLAGCASSQVEPAAPAPGQVPQTTSAAASTGGPTVAEAVAFADSAERVMLELSNERGRAQWIMANFITHDTEQLAAAANERYIAAQVELANRAKRYNDLELPYDTGRKLLILKTSLTAPAPSDPQKTAELTRLLASMESRYGSGEYCPQGSSECLDLDQLSEIIAKSRNPDSLLMAWTGWRTVSPPMRGEYARFVELANEGARELGFADLGAMWRSVYDMPPDAFAAEVDRLWNQVKPLYESLQCHVRHELGEQYGFELIGNDGKIPAHLLGNMWAQAWGNIYEIVAPPAADPGYDLSERLRTKGVDGEELLRYGERFFTSLGLAPLPQTFWERSLFTKPADREVVCHASAWDLDNEEDLRIKMCINVNAEDFQTVHHELGHNYYQRAYNEQPFFYRESANDGFHEALGDAVALSITPEYLKQLGLIDEVPPASADLGLLMRDALEKIAFLPFGLLVDQYRWKVFAGEITPANYNAGWWQLREQYQGVKAPVARTEEHFDPGAKYHVPANVPYTRYFLAHILQFQMHRALCQAIGNTGPLHRCSIYGNEEAGRRLQAMMEMGYSRPWPEALKALTGSEQMDATAILDYFAPLQTWLDQQNRGRQCGW